MTCSAHSSARARFMKKLQESPQSHEDFESLDYIDRLFLCVLGNEL